MPSLPFLPSPDVTAILNALLDIYERHEPGRPFMRAIRVRLDELDLPGYPSQIDPAPRQTANEQFHALAERGFVRLAWLPGETSHLLDAVTLLPNVLPSSFPGWAASRWPPRPPPCATCCWGTVSVCRRADWRRLAVDHTLAQLRGGKSPAPFSLADPDFNRDLLAALVALDTVTEETPYRVFSVRTFNDSKVFEPMKAALATLARHHGPGWGGLTPEETLRELG